MNLVVNTIRFCLLSGISHKRPSEKKIASVESLIRTVYNSPISHSNNTFLDEDNLSIVDKIAGPDVSYIERFHYWNLTSGLPNS